MENDEYKDLEIPQIIRKHSQQIKEYWKEQPVFWGIANEIRNSLYFLTLFNMMNFEDAKQVLEIGCGQGAHFTFLLKLKPKHCQWTATDNNIEMLAIAKKRIDSLKEEPLNEPKIKDLQPFSKKEYYDEFKLSLDLAEAEKLIQFSNNSFDRVISNLALQFTDNPEIFIEEAARVLMPKGKIGLSVWGRGENSTFLTLIPLCLLQQGIHFPDHSEQISLSQKETLVRLIEKNGFENIQVWYQYFPVDNSEETIMTFLRTQPTFKQIFSGLSGNVIEKIEKNIRNKVQEVKDRKETLGVEIQFITAQKK